MRHFGKFYSTIENKRKKLNITQTEACKAMGITIGAYHNAIKNKNDIRLEKIIALCDILKLSLDEAVERSWQPKTKNVSDHEETEVKIIENLPKLTEKQKNIILSLTEELIKCYTNNRSDEEQNRNARLAQLEEHLTLNHNDPKKHNYKSLKEPFGVLFLRPNK